MKGLVALIALKDAILCYDKLYSYQIPPDMQKNAKIGCRVVVPFGRGNLKKQGMIFKIVNDEVKGLKNIMSLTDIRPVLNEELIAMCEYMQECLFCTYYDAVHIMLPAGINYKLVVYYSVNSNFDLSVLSEEEKKIYSFVEMKNQVEEERLLKEFVIYDNLVDELVFKNALIKSSDAKRKIGDATQKWLKLSQNVEIDSLKLTDRQREIAEFVRDADNVSIREVMYYTGVTMSVINNLIEKNVLNSYEKQVFRTPYKASEVVEKSVITLTDEQQKAYDGMIKEYHENKGAVSLLYGITGSGKTQVFLSLVDTVSQSGKGVIVMVPEISLTPQLLSIFTGRYGDKIAVFHSAMSMGQRMDEWKRIKEGKALIAIGTRSAVFAPFKNLGLIIIDEEQEHTYKSEKTPRFHARELAKFRVKYNKGLLCLASATPSVESFTMAKNGKYSLYELKKRYGNAVLPTVYTVDMKKEILSGNSGSISSKLYEEINEALKSSKQAIILLNRRGHNTYISCPDCGYIASCPNCSISLTYHSANNRLMCHYCGYSVKADNKCPQCGKEHMKFMGIGTQKVEEELKLLFPNAGIVRVDADSTMTRESYSTYLDDFSKGKYNILLGTQMVAKGLNFPNVTVVGVLGADTASFSDDFRSFEKTFSLLTQVVGRAGRGESVGKAIIQTINPDGNIIELASRQDYESFYNEEILTRKLMIFPPYCEICVVSTSSLDRNLAENTINSIFLKIREKIDNEYKDVKLIILGPSPASVPKVNNRYRFRMIIKCKSNKKFRDMLRQSLDIKLKEDVSVSVDMNPETII